jgi:dTDP-4-amino-4,6-dideoxygalactose transaminase
MQTGYLHRYGKAKGDEQDVLELEREYAAYMGVKYCVGINSCGCGLFMALKCVDVKPGDPVLVNAFTLAPVPGAIAHCNAEPVLVEITDDYVIDLDDLRRKAARSKAKVLLLSHMRGHIADMDAVTALCKELRLTMIEDCAHTMGASWDGRMTGAFGTAGCFSSQTLKHINSGEGGFLVTNDEDIAAKAILYSGSYMLYMQHGARPDAAVFERWKGVIPNFSMRMSNLTAGILRPQLPLIDERAAIWNARYRQLAKRFAAIPHISVPKRPDKEEFVASSIQFSVNKLTVEQMQRFRDICNKRGVSLKWYGQRNAEGFTSAHHHWEYVKSAQQLPQSERIIRGLFDMHIPLTLTEADIAIIAKIIEQVIEEIVDLM